MLRAKRRRKLFYVLLSVVLICGTALPVYASEDSGIEVLAQEITSEQSEAGTDAQENPLPESSKNESSSSEGSEAERPEGIQNSALGSGMQAAASENEALGTALITDEETLQEAITAREPLIELAGSFDITGTIVIDSGYEVTITSDSAGPYTLQRAFSTGPLFRVNGSSQLTLQQVVFDGQDIPSLGSLVEARGQSIVILNDGAVLQNNEKAKGNGGGISIEDGSTLVLNSCCRIEGNTASLNADKSGLGGGVYIGDAGSKLSMHGGVITQNTSIKTGGGILVSTDAEGYISGGEISANGAPSSHGGGLMVGGYVEFSGGSIVQNYAKYGGGGVYNSKHFVMTGGNISGNYLTLSSGDGGGVWADIFASTEILGGVIGGPNPEDANKAKSGGGLFVEGYYPHVPMAKTVVSGNAIITGNEATYMGGGMLVVYPDGGAETLRSVEISGNAQITNNKAQHAAGVHIAFYADYGLDGSIDVTLGGNALISDNHATGQGGGLYLAGIDAQMTDGFTVSNNSAQYGGGIRLTKGASYPATSLSLSDTASVTNNTAVLGGGVCATSGVTLEATDGVAIEGNTADTGAGLYITGSIATLGGSTSVSNNKAMLEEEGNNTAGAAYVAGANVNNVYEPGVLNVGENVTVAGNTAGTETGGVYLDTGAIMNVSGSATFTGNEMAGNASAIALNQDALLNVWGSPQIGVDDDDNGIYLASGMAVTIPTGQDVAEDARVNFDSFEETAEEGTLVAQREDGSETAPDESPAMFCTVGRYKVVEKESALFKYILEEITYTVTYNDNGAEAGEVPVDEALYKQGDMVTVLENAGELTVKGMTFLGWGLSVDYEGEPLKAGETIEVADDHITFYALWDLDDKSGGEDPDPDDPDPQDPDPKDPDNRMGDPDQDRGSGGTTTTSGTSSSTNVAGGSGDNGSGYSATLSKTYDSVSLVATVLAALASGATALAVRRKRS